MDSGFQYYQIKINLIKINPILKVPKTKKIFSK